MQASKAIEGRHLVALRQRRIVEDRIDEIVHRAAQRHDGLADVDQFAGAFADNVDAQHLARVTVKDQFEPTGRVAADLPARCLAVVGHAHFIRNILVGQLLLGLANKADLGDRVDAVGVEAGVRRCGFVVEGPMCGNPSLFHRDRGQGREANHVAHSVDVLNLGLIVLVDRDAAAIVGFKTRCRKVQVIHRALT